jgi:hypothetical protein
MIEGHALDADTIVTHRVPWLSIAQLVLDGGSVTELIEALGKDAGDVVPPLLYPSPEPLHVTLPIYAVKMLEFFAVRGKTSVDECLAAILHEYAEELVMPGPQEVEEAIPGFEVALAFPDEPEPLP